MPTMNVPPRRPLVPVPDARLAGIPLARWLDALPDLALALLCLGALIMPARYGVAGVRWLAILSIR